MQRIGIYVLVGYRNEDDDLPTLYPDLFIGGRFYRLISSVQGFLYGAFGAPGSQVSEVEVGG